MNRRWLFVFVVLIAVLLLVITYGFLCPILLSARDTGLVVLGAFFAIGMPLAVIAVFIKLIHKQTHGAKDDTKVS